MTEHQSQSRRRFLATCTAGVTLLAGCQGDGAPDERTSAGTLTEETPAVESEAADQTITATRNPARPGGDDWPQFQYDARNTASNPGGRGPGGALNERWSYHVGTESMVAGDDSTVFSTVKTGRITALDGQTGEPRWTSQMSSSTSAVESVSGRLFSTVGNWLHELDPDTGQVAGRTPLPNPIAQNRLASYGQTIYVGTIDGVVHSIDTETMQVNWRYDTGAIPNLHVTDRTVFVGNSREGGGVLHAIDRTDGSLRWEFVTSTPSVGIPTAPATDEDTVYVGNDGAWFHAIDRESGTERWHRRVGGSVHAQPTIGASRIYLGLRGFPRGFIQALDVETGVSEWKVTLDGSGWDSAEVWTSPQLVDETLLVGSDNGQLYGLDHGNGEIRWQFATGNKVRSLVPLPEGVLLGNLDATIYRVASEGSEVWHYVGQSTPIVSTPIVGDGNVFIGGKDAKLHAIDEESGEQQWFVQTEQPVVGGSVFADGRVYLQAVKTGALDADSGEIDWSFRPMSFGITAPAFEDGVLYTCETSEIVDFNLYATDVAEGEVLWEQSTDSRLRASPAVSEAVVCTGSQAGVVYGFDAESGEILWEHPTGSRVEAGPTIADGLVYVGSRDGAVYALELNDGTERWSYGVREPVSRSPALDGDMLYVAAGQSLLALDTSTQTERWRVSVEGGTAPAVGDGMIYLGDRSGRIQARDSGSGELVASFNTGSGPIKAPVVAVNGSVYAGGADGRVYALDSGR